MAADAKPKQNDTLRTPKPKKGLGLTVPHALRLPHEDLILPLEEALRKDEKQNTTPTSMTSHTSRGSMTSMSTPTSHTQNSSGSPVHSKNLAETSLDIAPQRDYAKVANSITRNAVPAGLFSGKSKQLYDCLYALTRGAITPSRTVRISRPQLMKKAGIGSRITLDTNITRLITVGLITIRQINGEHSGNEYTVFLPEEIDLSGTSMTSQSSMTSPTQKLGILVGLETSHSRYTSYPEESTTYENPKTFFKTDDDDTHTARIIIAPVLEAARECVGGDAIHTEQERERWREVGQLIAGELRTASKRTSGISSVPAFLAAHLRRKFAAPQTSASPLPPTELSEKRTEATSILIPTQANNNRQSVPIETHSEELSGKEKATGEHTETKTATAPVTTSGGSRFTLEECRQYAGHLHQSGQGITNPGGYALTIYRTGEVDQLIEQFLKPQAKSVDASECPDCHGTGYFYPNGIEHGVAKCKHERMSNP